MPGCHLVRDLPVTDERLCVEVNLWNRPASLYENAGIMLYLDDSNYVRVNKESYIGRRDPPETLQVVSEVNGEFHDGDRKIAYGSDAHVSLRMRIDAETVTGFYRRARTGPWTEYGRVERPVTSHLQIGVETSYGEADSDRWAAFDDFRILAGC